MENARARREYIRRIHKGTALRHVRCAKGKKKEIWIKCCFLLKVCEQKIFMISCPLALRKKNQYAGARPEYAGACQEYAGARSEYAGARTE